jgi:ATP/maltotriose-dependent transcriptional regulator MalT
LGHLFEKSLREAVRELEPDDRAQLQRAFKEWLDNSLAVHEFIDELLTAEFDELATKGSWQWDTLGAV